MNDMKKKKILSLTLIIAVFWLTAAHTSAVTKYSDGIYTFEKTETNTAIITDCGLTDENISVPEFVLGYPVVGIGSYAFMNNSDIESVTLPISLYSIGEYAFANDPQLLSVTIPRWCAQIAENAFWNSPNVTMYCYTDTPAHRYAEEHGVSYTLLDAPKPKTDIGSATVMLEETVFPYNGEAHCPKVTVTLGDTALDPETDYTVEYADHTEPGEATVTVIGTGDYDGRTSASFSIRYMRGDTDGDGTVTIIDATCIQRYLANYHISFSFNEAVADADEDEIVTITDATYIQRWLVDLQSNDNIGKPI